MAVPLWIHFLMVISPAAVLAQNDLTIVPGASGKAVVEATLQKLQERCFFQHDNLYLRRLAYVLKRYGTDASTYTPTYHGGIWQISRTAFQITQRISNDSATLTHFGFKWSDLKWDDLRKPLYSAIAAGFVALSKNPRREFPVTEPDQASLFRTMYGKNTNVFLSGISNLDTKCTSEELDIVFILDASGSVSFTDYQTSKKFTAQVISKFDVGQNAVRVALISYSSSPLMHFGFSVHNSAQSAASAALRIGKSNGGTNTAAALNLARTSLFSSTKSRTGVAKVAIVLTDGASNSFQGTNRSAQSLKDLDVEVFAIGIGNGIRQVELDAIASKPKCMHTREPKRFDELIPLIADIKQVSCTAAPVIGDGGNGGSSGGTNNTYSCLHEKTFKLALGDGDSILIRPASGKVTLYGSFSTSLPNEAVNDFQGVARSWKPVVIYVRSTWGTISLTVEAAVNQTGECQTHYELVVYKKNILNFQTDNMCVQNRTLANCTYVEIFTGTTIGLPPRTDANTGGVNNVTQPPPGSFSPTPRTVVGPTPSTMQCPGTRPGKYPHPTSQAHFVVCLETGLVYEFPCPAGLEYDVNTQICSKSIVSPTDGNKCKVCTTDNWTFGLRRFAVPGNTTAYLACSYIDMCSIKSCEAGKFWNQTELDCTEQTNTGEFIGPADFPCGQFHTIQVLAKCKSTIKIHPRQGSVEVFGSFSDSKPSARSYEFKSVATDTTPAIFFVRDASGPMYLTIGGGSGRCVGYVHVTRENANALHKFGSHNTCLVQHIEMACTDMDFLGKYNYSEHHIINGQVNGQNFPDPCSDSSKSFTPHPSSANHFIYCPHNGRLLVVECPKGSHYEQAAKDCVKDTVLDAAKPCRACHSDNWHLKKTTFPFPGDVIQYINCSDVDKCSVLSCPPSTKWSQSNKACESTAPPLRPGPISFNCKSGKPGQFYFAYPGNRAFFVQCDTSGNAYLMPCPPGTKWKQAWLTCAHS